MRPRARLVALLGLIALGGGVLAQRPDAPARDNPARAQQRTSNLIVSGRVTDLASNRPLPRAKVSLSTSADASPLPVFTDNDGRFAVSVSTGRYSILVEKTGYARLRYGARTELDPPMEIEVSPDLPAQEVDIRLIKGAAIFGRITDDFGDPIIGSDVTVNVVQFMGSSARLLPVSRPPAATNDLGDYRIGDLPPGRYYISVAAAGLGTMPAGTPREWEHLVAWGRTFYPGSTSIGNAISIAVGAGEERGGVDFAVRPFDRIRLTLAFTGIMPPEPTPGPSGSFIIGREQFLNGNFILDDENDGGLNIRTFSIAGLGNGSMSTPVPIDEGDWIFFVRQGPLGMITHLRVSSGEELTVNVDLHPGSTVSGRVVFDGARAAPPATGVQISVKGAGPEAAIPARLYLPRAVSAKADGTFAIPELFGSIQLLADPPPGWTLKSVLLGGRDLLDEPLTLEGARNVSGVQIVLSDQVASLSGTTAFADGTPAAGCTVAVFPDAAVTRFNPRRMKLFRSGQHGEFRLRDLPSGAYRIVAAADIDASMWMTDAAMAALRARSTPITLADRAQQTTDLTCQVMP